MVTVSVAFLYLLLISYSAYKKPALGICLVINAFFLNSALSLTGGMPFILIGAVSLLVFSSILMMKFFVFEGNKYLPVGFDGVAGLLLIMILMLTSLFGENLNASINVILRFLFLCLSYGILIKIVMASRGVRVQHILQSYLFIGLLVAIYALLNGDSSSEYFMRLAIGNESSIPLSLLVAQSMLISLYFSICAKERVVMILYSALFLFFLYVLLLTNTRSTLLASVVSIFFILIKFKRYKVLSTGVIGSVVFLLAIPTLGLLGGGDFDRVVNGFIRLLGGGFGESESDRVLAWSTAIDIFSDNIFAGLGSGNFGQYYIVYPHNIFLEILAENGIFGFIFLLIYTGYGVYLSLLSRSEGVIFAGLFIFSLIVSQVSLTLWMHKAMFFWLGALSYYTYLQKHTPQIENSSMA